LRINQNTRNSHIKINLLAKHEKIISDDYFELFN
jgi:hypothetical protein